MLNKEGVAMLTRKVNRAHHYDNCISMSHAARIE